jgi:integrase
MHYHTEAELKAILRELPSDRHRLLVLVTLYHGLRASESLALRGKNIEGGHVSIKRLKGSKPCYQPFLKHPDPELDEHEQLLALSKTVKPTERLFPMFTDRADYVYAGKGRKASNSSRGRIGFYQMIRRAARRVGIKSHPHMLKHTCGMMAMAIDNDVRDAQVQLGHANLGSTTVYVQKSQRQVSKGFAKVVLRMSEALDGEE